MNAIENNALWMIRTDLQQLIDVLLSQGYQVIAPTVHDDAIALQPITSIDQLPIGWSDAQKPGSYTARNDGHGQFFAYNCPADSWKKFLFPPSQYLSGAALTDDGWKFETLSDDVPPLALLGVRACDLAAIAIQDRVFFGEKFCDPVYSLRRSNALILAVNCSTAAPTCFCTSMDTGPQCEQGFDLALTELSDGFFVQVGSDAGELLIAGLNLAAATDEQHSAVGALVASTREKVTKQFDNSKLPELLMNNLQHPHWNVVAERCLSCSNCTMVCPTCFCSSVEEVSDLQQKNTRRKRQWDSCFSFDFAYTAGGVVRDSIRSRYRQWLTHKLATWHDQFDTSGCTGCGRCITWCPVGIDLTAEVAAIRDTADNFTQGESDGSNGTA